MDDLSGDQSEAETESGECEDISRIAAAHGGMGVAAISCFYALPPDSFGAEAFCFRLSIRLFVWTDLVTTMSHEWLEQSRQVPTDDLIRFWRSKVTAGRRAGASKSIF